MESIMTIFGWNLAAVTGMMILGWVVSLIIKNVTIVDSLWGLGFILIAWLTFFLSDGFGGRKLLIAALVTLWGLRLSLYLTWRNRGLGEDPRYGSWRENNPERFWIVSLFKVFILQSLFLWVISATVQFGQTAPQPDRLGLLDMIGTLIFAIGFLFESIADQQLAGFKSNPLNKGKVMDKGLWHYSRHPNYFGECLIWWGLFTITLSVPNGWWTIISPVIITTVLLKMTGIPLTEKNLAKSRPGYAAYVGRTRSFIPWFPKEDKHEQSD